MRERTARNSGKRASARHLLSGAVAAVCIALVAASAARADSIWDNRDRPAAFLYTDNLAADVGDSLTVLIADQSSFKKKGEREMEKTTSGSGSVTVKTSLVDLTIPAGDLQQQSSRKFEGSNEYTSSRQFVDSITATVIDRLPNGNLVIAGRGERTIAGEDVVTILTGITKPEDISGANTISSTRVANLRIYYDTTGPSDAYMEPGFLNRIFDFIWPF